MLPYGLKNSERPAEALAHQSARIRGSFRKRQGTIFVHHAPAILQQRHGQVCVLGHRVSVVATGLADRSHAPRANRSGDHAYGAKYVESAALKILAGDVLKRLPAGPQVHAIADFS